VLLPDVWAKSLEGKVGGKIALTFDDGPDTILTPQLLDILRTNKIKATFFPIGEKLARHPGIIAEVAKDGHEIGNHGWGHLVMTRLSNAHIKREIWRTTEALLSICGVRPKLFRPPHGMVDARLRRAVAKEGGLRMVTWNLTCDDWRKVSPEHIESQILGKIRGGSVVLMHDINPSTIIAMKSVAPTLRSKGFAFVTLSELLAVQKLVP